MKRMPLSALGFKYADTTKLPHMGITQIRDDDTGEHFVKHDAIALRCRMFRPDDKSPTGWYCYQIHDYAPLGCTVTGRLFVSKGKLQYFLDCFESVQ